VEVRLFLSLSSTDSLVDQLTIRKSVTRPHTTRLPFTRKSAPHGTQAMDSYQPPTRLAVDYLFLANNGLEEPIEPSLEPFNASGELNDYEVRDALLAKGGVSTRLLI
jgi:hypothetical protein